MNDTGWFKSSYSTGGNDNCVEVRLTDATAAVRDSKNPEGSSLQVPLTSWHNFLRSSGPAAGYWQAFQSELEAM
ncbi:DUF397 domain-containing protein [Saccharothrix obliqua]|uniref:DUF397 domain-containing protein n=1 Tax=Saccharothrix obliqua TaxID=2861747 RepID=UPI001C606BB5|nr:DUF397 domain-containing protein [Saccharothrix obliqua]MBW4716340.1 DUF397 domain-containing protein [Saccharothrix obliqua]